MNDSSAVTIEPIELDRIRDAGAQMREEMHAETVAEYAEAMMAGAVFPAIVVYSDGSGDFFIGDGFHRFEAAKKTGRETISAEVRHGTARDAILCGVGANATHGLRRTHADKRRAVVRLLQDAEWARWSDRAIGEAARVDGKTVAKIRRELAGAEFRTSDGKPTAPAEFRTPTDKPSDKTSLLDDVLRKMPDDVILAECRRRGLAVSP